MEGRHIDHSTFAKFRTRFHQPLKELFKQIGRLAMALGLIRLGEVGFDPRRAHLASVSLSEDFGQVFVIPTSAEAALTDTMLVCPMMF